PVERVRQHVAATGVAAAELGKVLAQALIFALHDLGGHVVGCHASPPAPLFATRRGGTLGVDSTGQAVNVDPVVPVKRTRRYVPIHSAGPSTRAILFVRVLVCSRSPRFAGPSTSTSCVVPTSRMFFCFATRRTTAMSLPMRSVLVSSRSEERRVGREGRAWQRSKR